MRLSSELITFKPCIEHIYTGPCVFFTSKEGAEFFENSGYDHTVTHHSDGIYGWNQRLPHLASVISLGCRHYECMTHHESILQIASVLKSLHDAYSEGFAHLSRHASSLAVPQVDSLCGDGPSVKGGETCNISTTGAVLHASALATMESEAAHQIDAPFVPQRDAPIESTAPL